MLVVTRLNAHRYQQELDSMHRLRHRILVDQMGWDNLRKKDGLERDQFDHDEAVYLLTTDEDRNTTACLRLVPSLSPSLTRDVFSHLCDLKPAPYGEDIYDASRIVVDPRLKKAKKRTPDISEIYCAWFEAGMALGLRSYISVIHTGLLTSAIAFGWDVEPLGTPQDLDGESTVAAQFNVNRKQLDFIHQLRELPEPVLSDQDLELLRVTHRIAHQSPARRAA